MTLSLPAPNARQIIFAAAIGIGLIVTASVLLVTGRLSLETAAAAASLANSLGGAVAFLAFLASWRQTVGYQRAVSRTIAIACAVWSLGGLIYLAFILSGGTVLEPAAWSQAGYLLAYPFWYRALWLLRQPTVGSHGVSRINGLAIELASLGVFAVLVIGLLWYPPLPADINIALLVPIALDLVLLAGLWNAVRRAALDRNSIYPWLAVTFGAFLLCDALSSYLVARGKVDYLGIAGVGYCIAVALLAAAAGREIRARESARSGERVTGAIGAAGLAGVGPAAALVPSSAALSIWALGAVLAWRMYDLLATQGGSDQDPLTGVLDKRALARHAGGLIAGASGREPIALIAVDVNGFSAWNSANGFAAGDRLLAGVAESCASSSLGPGTWGRIGADRFCWVGRVHDAEQAGIWAQIAVAAATSAASGLAVRGAYALCPDDATTEANATAAIDEALGAARESERAVVAFDRGLLDGAAHQGNYSASFRMRRERVAKVLNDASAIRTVFQPIVSLADLSVSGHEALSRFKPEPLRGPDVWIAESQQVGLGLELEAECLRRAVTFHGDIPPETYLSINASPQLIMSGMVHQSLPTGALGWLMIEITEHDQVRDYAALAEKLSDLRSRGARVAIDDLGAGHSTLQHLMRLAPDCTKLDRSLVQDIDSDLAKQALVRSMVAFSRELRSGLVAEGVETAQELACLREIGVGFGQGYLFRHPLPDFVARLETRDILVPGVVVTSLSLAEAAATVDAQPKPQ
jgi:EAL domain-containing protein (putative c-di-GMP-specific phosphodiesterase class I)/GGDEF domain-containing protein